MKKNENTLIILKTWKKEEELILKEWADKAICYKWLHLKSHEKFRSINAYYTIPVIILSTVTGTANFAQDRVPIQYLNYYVMTVGTLNLIAGIISTIHQYLKIAQINEAHRVAYIAWDKFSRNIRIELAKNPKERTPVAEMLKICKEEYDRLEETSPSINNDAIDKFKDTFGEIQDLIKPDILGKITPTMIFDREEHKNDDDDLDDIQRIVNENSSLTLEKEKLQKEKNIENIRIQFLQTKGRLPTFDEIEDFVLNKA